MRMSSCKDQVDLGKGKDEENVENEETRNLSVDALTDKLISVLDDFGSGGEKAFGSVAGTTTTKRRKNVDPLSNASIHRFLNEISLEKDLGFYHFNRWSPDGKTEGASITEDRILSLLDFEAFPSKTTSLQNLNRKCPTDFKSLSPKGFPNYPAFFKESPKLLVPFLFAKKKLLGNEVNSGSVPVDFVISGSILALFDSRILGSKRIFVQKLRDTIFVKKHASFETNLNEYGFQFERLVCGRRFEDEPEYYQVNHVQLLKIGDHKVLVSAEVDAYLEEQRSGKFHTVEIKANNKRYWNHTLAFQMLSNGSAYLVHGEKLYRGRGQCSLQSVRLYSLEQIFSLCGSSATYAAAQKRILSCFSKLAKTYLSQNQVYEVHFGNDFTREMTIVPLKVTSSKGQVLPLDSHKILN